MMENNIKQNNKSDGLISTLEKITDPNTRSLFEYILQLISTANKIITRLKNKVTDLEARVSVQERYAPKSCGIVESLPVVDGKALYLSQQVYNFLGDFLNYDTTPSNFKVCHFLRPGRDLKIPSQLS